jgi:phosphate transport system substrate-binding protein
MPEMPKDPAAATSALKFFSWAYEKGTDTALALDYIPMPANVVTLVKKAWADNIKNADGKPLQF